MYHQSATDCRICSTSRLSKRVSTVKSFFRLEFSCLKIHLSSFPETFSRINWNWRNGLAMSFFLSTWFGRCRSESLCSWGDFTYSKVFQMNLPGLVSGHQLMPKKKERGKKKYENEWRKRTEKFGTLERNRQTIWANSSLWRILCLDFSLIRHKNRKLSIPTSIPSAINTLTQTLKRILNHFSNVKCCTIKPHFSYLFVKRVSLYTFYIVLHTTVLQSLYD